MTNNKRTHHGSSPPFPKIHAHTTNTVQISRYLKTVTVGSVDLVSAKSKLCWSTLGMHQLQQKENFIVNTVCGYRWHLLNLIQQVANKQKNWDYGMAIIIFMMQLALCLWETATRGASVAQSP